MENTVHCNWTRLKLLLWKNWRVYYSQKVSLAWEFFTPLMIGISLLVVRSLLPQPFYSDEIIYPDFSPTFLPLGKVPDVDAIFQSSRWSNRAAPVAEGVCEMLRRGLLNPGNLSIESFISIAKKFTDTDLTQIDFKQPEFINLINIFDLPAIFEFFKSEILNDNARKTLQFLLDLSPAEELQTNLVEIVTDILQSRRQDMAKKFEELWNQSASFTPNVQRWIVIWSPVSNKILSAIMNEAATITPFISCGVENSSLLLDALTRPLPISQEFFTLAGVAFPDSLNDSLELPNRLPITLRFPGLSRIPIIDLPNTGTKMDSLKTLFRTSWETINIFPKSRAPGLRNINEPKGGPPGYFREGFLGLQSSISEAIIRYYNQSTGGRMPPLRVRLQRFPSPPSYNDPHGFLMMMVVILSPTAFLAQIISTVRRIVAEKESQFKEILRTLGVERWVQWTAWFLLAFAGFLLISAFLTFILKIEIYGQSVFPFSDPLFVFGVLVAFSLTAVSFCFLMSTFFSTATNAAAGSAAIWIVLCFVFAQTELRSVRSTQGVKILISLIPSCGVLYAFQSIWSLESTGMGLHKETFNYSFPDSENIPVSTIVCTLILESVILLLAALYREAVSPGPAGIPLPWYFPFTRRFWFGGRTEPDEHYEDTSSDKSVFIESEPNNLAAGIQIKGLRKVYSNGNIGVQRLSLNLYEGQITVLLGHNGAGKTTIMSMLTGMCAPTSGSAVVANCDLIENINGVRKHLGVCPQSDHLLDDLTVNEHLYFFCKLKGLSNDEIRAEMKKYLKILQLEPQAEILSKNLSGGMKRKLSAALALCGGTKIVLLDEPTTGMDPAARRALWDLLKAEKTKRTILLTTHFMDEADFLGDRIAIMSQGLLRAAGSSFFLKKKYGGGYTLVLALNPACKSHHIMKLIEDFIPGIQPLLDVGSELSFRLPESRASEFASLFEAIEKNSEAYGIDSFGIISASINDVFMNVISEQHPKISTKIKQTLENNDNNATCASPEIQQRLVGFSLLLSQFQALFQKHWIVMARAPVSYVIVLLYPALTAFYTIIGASRWEGTNDPDPRSFSYKDYPKSYAALFGENNSIFEAFGKIVTSEGGFLKNLTAMHNASLSILKFNSENPLSSKVNFITALEVNSENITAFFNNEPFHTAPLALQHAYNSFLNAHVGENIRLEFTNHPLPFPGIIKAILQQNGMNTIFHLSYQGAFIFVLLTSWFLMSHVREKTIGSKLLQLMAGVNPVLYWTVAFIRDVLFCVLAVLLFVSVPYAYQDESFSTIEAASKIVVVGTSFFVVAVIINFLFTFVDWEPSKAFMNVSVIGYLTGAFIFALFTIVRLNKLLSDTTADFIADVLTWSPTFALAESLMNINRMTWLLRFCEPIQRFCSMPQMKHVCCKEAAKCPEEGCLYWTDNFLDMRPPGVGYAIQTNLVVAIAACLVLYLIETKSFTKFRLYFKKPKVSNWKPVDDDVYREAQLVKNICPAQRKSCNLLISELAKNYGNLKAVKNLSLLISAGECFGLLGENGAGKTTAFRMLTGDLEPSSGDAFVNGFSMRSNRKQVHKMVGYCPQFDALLEEFTGRETLRLFCKLRGIPDAEVEVSCEKLARDLLFYPYIDHMVKNYSGGNKRKLSTAVALAGDPPVVLLDEPTTGMDPIAKRYFWNVISNLRSSGKTIVLTSHSMEECEALCTRVGIMVSGELLALGSLQHLKTKFAQGHCLTVKIGPDRNEERRKYADRKPVVDYIQEKIPGAVINEIHDSVHTYHIPSNNSSWSEMFKTLESARTENHIEDYYLGQTSLEEVFLSIAAKEQKSY